MRGQKMSDRMLYVGSEDKNGQLTGYVRAKFLMRNGMHVMDPAPGGSQKAFLYSDVWEETRREGKSQTRTTTLSFQRTTPTNRPRTSRPGSPIPGTRHIRAMRQ